MTKIVLADRRYSPWSRGNKREGWIVLTQYEGRAITPRTEIPTWLIDRWETSKSELGYATFRDFSAEEALLVVALAKSGSAHLSINRWGQVNGYKLKPLNEGRWEKKS